ncbi:hypothetical protein OG21DRAFT_625975 [Imleria badia]|nr:hypothetical protein OG21DRAFT_625975 [Imleria badia]
MPADSTLGVSSMKRHQDYYLRDGNICFLVESTLFRLHKYFFERESDYFRDRLGPSSEGEVGSPDSPYIIHDTKTDDFADFVWVFYNPAYSYSKQTKEKWLTILRLATQWRFAEIRNLAIRHLEKVKLEPIEKITMYKRYLVDSELLLPSYMALCTSPTLPSPEEGRILTLDTVLKLASARERVLLRASELGCKTPTIASAPEDVVRAVVAEWFDLALHSDDQNVRVEGQAANNNAGDNAATEVVTIKHPNAAKKGKVSGDATQALPAQNVLNGVGSGAGKGKRGS